MLHCQESIVDRILLDAGVSPKALLASHYNELSQSRLASSNQRQDAIVAREMVAWMPTDFLKGLAEATGASLVDLIKLFKNSRVVKFFHAIKWSFKKLYDLLKTGYKVYRDLQKAVAEYVAETKVVKWTAGELKKLDEWLKNHPRLRRVAGIGVAALLVYIWFNMSFTGDYEFDFDMSDVLGALSGSFSFEQLFASPDGLRMLVSLAVGAGLHASFPWPGPTSIHFIGSIISSIAQSLGVRLKGIRG